MRALKINRKITTRETSSVSKYLQDVSKYELITPEKEIELTERIKQGDEQAKQELVNANLRFVVSVAKQYHCQPVPLLELINEGNCGLIKAAERFDHTKGFKFISYAVWWIRQSILKYLSEHAKIVRLPLNKIQASSKAARAHDKFIQENGYAPSNKQLAKLINTSVNNIKYMNVSQQSLDAPVRISNNDEGSMYDILESDVQQPDHKLSENESLKSAYNRVIQILDPRSRTIVEMKTGINNNESMTFSEIGDHFGLTRERTRQLFDLAIRRIRESPNAMNILRQFL